VVGVLENSCGFMSASCVVRGNLRAHLRTFWSPGRGTGR
jgi:hypothetical protein